MLFTASASRDSLTWHFRSLRLSDAQPLHSQILFSSPPVMDESDLGSGSSLLSLVQRALLHRRVNSPDSCIDGVHNNERRLVVVTSLSSDPAILTRHHHRPLHTQQGHPQQLPEDERAELRRAAHSAGRPNMTAWPSSTSARHERLLLQSVYTRLCASIVRRPLRD